MYFKLRDSTAQSYNLYLLFFRLFIIFSAKPECIFEVVLQQLIHICVCDL